MKRNATAIWNGTGKEGSGNITTQSGVLSSTPYAYNTRFENEKGTNPEELIAAAHAGCFTMHLTFNIDKAGHKVEQIETTCEITLESGTIVSSILTVKAKVDGLTDDKFQHLVNDSKLNCPVSKLLKANVEATATLQ